MSVYLLAGVPGSGKSSVCEQLRDKFFYVSHDKCGDFLSKVILDISKSQKKPILTDCPFAERKLKDELEAQGLDVIPVFIVEDPNVIARRYELREKKPASKATLTRASSILERAREWNAFHGTSDEVLNHLRSI